MKTYEYRGFDGDGRARKGLVEADTVKQARERLAASGVLADRVALTGRSVRFPRPVRAMVYRELSALLNAGLPLTRGLEIMIRSPELGECGSLLATVRDLVQEGAPLSRAFAGSSGAVTPFEAAIMDAAERSAALPEILDELAGFLEEDERIRASIQNALAYPLLVAGVGICIAVLMLGLAVPRAREIVLDSRMPVPWITSAVVALGRGALYGLPVLGVAGGALWLRMRRRLRTDEDLRVAWDRRAFSVPVLGRGYRVLVNLRFARTLAILLRGGVPVIEGVELAGKASGSAWVKRLCLEQAEAVRHGASLSAALRNVPPLADTLPGWVQVGEASGGLARLLQNAGQRYEEHWSRFVSRSLALLEPVLIAAVGAFVLLITLAILLPVISLSRAVGA